MHFTLGKGEVARSNPAGSTNPQRNGSVGKFPNQFACQRRNHQHHRERHNPAFEPSATP